MTDIRNNGGSSLVLRKQWLVENPTPRLAVCLCLDCSPSMSGDPSLGAPPGTIGVPIDELNEGVRAFFQSVRDDPRARYAAEISLVGFSGEAELLLDFDPIEKVAPPTLFLELEHGGTSIGSAVDKALAALERRKNEYQSAGVDYFQPWLVLMTDGQPTDMTHLAVSERVREMVSGRKLSVFAIGIGDGADMGVLGMFSPTRAPLKLKGLSFPEFFEWLSRSVSTVSQSTPGEKVKLDQEGIKGWAEL